MKWTVISLILLQTMVLQTNAQQPEVIDRNTLESMMSVKNDTTYVMNFWATWCKPCVKEIPYFENINTTYSKRNCKVILVSLDFKSQLHSKLIPFIERHQIKSKVVLLDDTDYDSWIDKVDPNWDGAIPATLIFNNHKGLHKFYQQEFSETELNELINNIIK
jgi:thiol-disulfide isomerase/thioredoxin